MKAYALITIASFGFVMPSTLLAQAEGGHEAHHPPEAAAAGAPTAAAPSAQAPAPATQAAPTVQTMPSQAALTQMREQMAKVREAKDPAERQRLLQEHLKSMQDAMKILDGMMEAQAAAAGPEMGMMGGGRRGGMMGEMMGGGNQGGMMGGGQQGGMMGGMMGKGMTGGGQRSGMGGCPMMGGEQGGMMEGMMQRHMMTEQKGHFMANRMNVMEKRLNAMQMLLDQVLQHLSATQGQG